MAVAEINPKKRIGQFEEYLNETFKLRQQYIPEETEGDYKAALDAYPPVTPPEPVTPDLSRLFGLAKANEEKPLTGKQKAGKFVMNWLTTIDPEIAAQQVEREKRREQLRRDRYREAIDLIGAEFHNAQLKQSYELEKARITNAGRQEAREFLLKIAGSKKAGRLQDWITAQNFFNKDVGNAAALERWGTSRGGGKASVGRTTKLWDQDHGKGGIFTVTPQPPRDMKEAIRMQMMPGSDKPRALDPSDPTDAKVIQDIVFGPTIKSRIMDSGADPQRYYEMLKGKYPNVIGETTFNEWWGPRQLPPDEGEEPFKYKEENIPSASLDDGEFLKQTVKVTGSKTEAVAWFLVKKLADGDFEEAIKLLDQTTVRTWLEKQRVSPFEVQKALMDIIDEKSKATEEE